MLIAFSAFVLFYLVYGLFAIFHMVKFSRKGDLATPSVFIFSLVSIGLIALAYLAIL